MARIAATVLAGTPSDYAERVNRVKSFAEILHVDVADGVFVPAKTVGIGQVYGLSSAELHLHLMVEHPELYIESAISLEPALVILHFESAGDLTGLFQELKAADIRAGLAIKLETTIEQVKNLLPQVDHLLVFTGTLGYNHGEFHAECLEKIQQAKRYKPELEIGVDGGVDQATSRLAIEAGANLLDCGSFIHDSADPEAAYLGLKAIAQGTIA
jgi:ribulose-phosphate 3-epimerase